MSSRRPHEQPLRNIGQTLEAGPANDFKLRHEDDCYCLQIECGDKQTSLWDWLRRRGRVSHVNDLPLEYRPEEIARLERVAQRRRSIANRLPDFYNLSNVLRTVGAYLDWREARLIELQKNALSVTLLYRNADGRFGFEERSIASFYAFFLELHGRRGAKRAYNDRK